MINDIVDLIAGIVVRVTKWYKKMKQSKTNRAVPKKGTKRVEMLSEQSPKITKGTDGGGPTLAKHPHENSIEGGGEGLDVKGLDAREYPLTPDQAFVKPPTASVEEVSEKFEEYNKKLKVAQEQLDREPWKYGTQTTTDGTPYQYRTEEHALSVERELINRLRIQEIRTDDIWEQLISMKSYTSTRMNWGLWLVLLSLLVSISSLLMRLL